MPRYRLLIEYDGTDFSGWQKQQNAPSVQEAVEHVLATVLREPVGILGSGRTDTGVHARGQVAHFDTEARLDASRLFLSFAGLLPPSIVVRAVEPAPQGLAPGGFHARFDAIRRTYHYHVAMAPRALDWRTRVSLWPVPDIDVMNHAAEALLGQHDFSSFCRTKSETTNRICSVETVRWVPDGRPGDWRFEIAANRFLHGMVRAVVGTLLQIGCGRRDAEALAGILGARDRRAAGPAAPPHGLVLHHVGYAAPPFAECD